MAWPETVRKSDLRITWFSGSGAGGQHRNKHRNCCRMTHIPTGKKSQCQDHKSREMNQQVAFRRLSKQLAPIMKMEATRERYAAGPERVRTYHAVRGAVKDHRTEETYGYDDVLQGDGLKDVIVELVARKKEG